MNEIIGFLSRPNGSSLSDRADRSDTSRVHLTPRQLDVLTLLCEGKSNKVIGRTLDIAAATVKVHVSCILRALKVHSRLQAVLKANELRIAVSGPAARDADEQTGASGSAASNPSRGVHRAARYWSEAVAIE